MSGFEPAVDCPVLRQAEHFTGLLLERFALTNVSKWAWLLALTSANASS